MAGFILECMAGFVGIRSGLSFRAMSANDTCVLRRMFKSRIAARIAFSAVGLTAGVNPPTTFRSDGRRT